MGYLDALFSDPRISSLLSGTPTSGGGNLYGPPARAPLNNTFTPEYFAQMFGGQKPSIPQGYSPTPGYGPPPPAYSVLNPKPVGGGALIPQGYSPSYGPPPPQYSVLNPQPVGGSLPAPTAPWNTLTEAGGGRRFFEPVNTFSSSNTAGLGAPTTSSTNGALPASAVPTMPSNPGASPGGAGSMSAGITSGNAPPGSFMNSALSGLVSSGLMGPLAGLVGMIGNTVNSIESGNFLANFVDNNLNPIPGLVMRALDIPSLSSILGLTNPEAEAAAAEAQAIENAMAEDLMPLTIMNMQAAEQGSGYSGNINPTALGLPANVTAMAMDNRSGNLTSLQAQDATAAAQAAAAAQAQAAAEANAIANAMAKTGMFSGLPGIAGGGTGQAGQVSTSTAMAIAKAMAKTGMFSGLPGRAGGSDPNSSGGGGTGVPGNTSVSAPSGTPNTGVW